MTTRHFKNSKRQPNAPTICCNSDGVGDGIDTDNIEIVVACDILNTSSSNNEGSREVDANGRGGHHCHNNMFHKKNSNSISSTILEETDSSDDSSSDDQKNNSNNNNQENLTDYEKNILLPALSKRSYHIPNNTFYQDWKQYICNNHPIISICCHHKLHPIGKRLRILNFISSIMFGLCITNCMWLWFFYHPNNQIDLNHNDHSSNSHNFFNPRNVINQYWKHDNNESDHTIDQNSTERRNPSLFNNVTTMTDDNYSTNETEHDYYANSDSSTSSSMMDINTGMIFLWTVGGMLHALYDTFIWYVEVCFCCYNSQNIHIQNKYQRTKVQKCGTYMIILLTILFTTIGTFIILIRADLQLQHELEQVDEIPKYSMNTTTIDHNESHRRLFNLTNIQNNNFSSDGFFGGSNHSVMNNNGDVELPPIQTNLTAYDFLFSFVIEMTLAYCIYYPTIATILFMGILDCCCGVIPIIGGRPYEMKHQEQQND